MLIGLLPLQAHAQPQDPPPAYLIEYSSAPMTRNAALLDTSLRLFERGTDWAVDEVAGDLVARKSAGGFFTRLGLTLADFVVVGIGSTVAHEYQVTRPVPRRQAASGK